MKQVLVFGAGRSSIFLIEYLAKYVSEQNGRLLVCDIQTEYAETHVGSFPSLHYRSVDIQDTELVQSLIAESTLVVSLLPAVLHINIARICLELTKDLATASYISEAMLAMHEEVKSKGIVFLNEMGLDPGIDHMSAMQMMDDIHQKGGIIKGFKSYCGGLTNDANDGDNPWKYKFSWNPRNVVLAGQGSPALYLENSALKLKPYYNLFSDTELLEIEDYGTLEAYPNRDSLHYIELYGLHDISTMLRGTFRKQGYCAAWQVLIRLGMTDDSLVLNLPAGTTMKQWLSMYVKGNVSDLRNAIQKQTSCSDIELAKLEWLGLFSEEQLPLLHASSAGILEEILKHKWALQPNDRDLVVMLHILQYELNGVAHEHRASMVLTGENSIHTAMAKTVGLPLAIACKMLLEKKISIKGVIAPVYKEIYEPVLNELGQFGIVFKSKDTASV